MFLDEIAREQRYVFTALPQWWNVQRKNMQPVVEVSSKTVARHHRLQVAVGGGHEPGDGTDRAITADALEFLVLNGAEQLRLEFQRHFADLVEKQSSMMRQFEASDLLRHRSGE